MLRDALISECGLFRYWLLRQWDTALPLLLFVMLNPSTADALIDDPTIGRCISFAKAHGFGGIVVVNLYAYRATKPADLRAAGYPVGDDNDQHIAWALAKVARVCCAWGADADRLARPAEVLKLIRSAGHTPHALGRTTSGAPRHPLYLRGDARLEPMA